MEIEHLGHTENRLVLGPDPVPIPQARRRTKTAGRRTTSLDPNPAPELDDDHCPVRRHERQRPLRRRRLGQPVAIPGSCFSALSVRPPSPRVSPDGGSGPADGDGSGGELVAERHLTVRPAVRRNDVCLLPKGGRSRPALQGDPRDRHLLASRPADPDRRRAHRRRNRARRVVTHRALPQRRCVRHARRYCPDPRLVGQDGAPQAQPLRGPPAQPRHLHRRHHPVAARPRGPRLRHTPPRARQDRPRDPALPRSIRHPAALPTALPTARNRASRPS